MAKINLLNNITDDQYINVVENLRMNSTITYQDSLLAIRRKSITVEATRKSNPRCRTNNLRQPQKGTQRTNTKPKWFLPRKTWDKMFAEERKAHRDKNNSPKKQIQKQYSSSNKDASTNDAVSSKEKETYELMSDTPTIQSERSNESTLTEHQQKFVNMIRHINTSRIIQIPVSHAFKLRASSNFTQDTMLADSGCDTMMYGQGWKVEAITGQKVSVQGFKDDIQAIELEIGSLITAIDLPDQTIILEANEVIMMPQNQTSLLSTFKFKNLGIK